MPTLSTNHVDPAPAMVVEGLSKSYGGTSVLRRLHLRAERGEFVVLLGANGSGKSTALRCILGLSPADSGSVRIGGAPAFASGSGRGTAAAAMIFQRVNLVARRSALHNTCAGALGRLPLHRSLHPLMFPDDLRREAREHMHRVGMARYSHVRADRLSGGQQQRVAIARALCQRAPLLLADEPVAALDPAAAEEVLALLRELAHDRGIGVVAVLHQPELARRYADRLVGLHRGATVFDDAPERITRARIEQLYEQQETA